jgi:hypothetical protein
LLIANSVSGYSREAATNSRANKKGSATKNFLFGLGFYRLLWFLKVKNQF